MTRPVLSVAVAAMAVAALGGCSGTAGLSTSSIFGGGGAAPAAKATTVASTEPAPPDPGNPSTRALQVGSTAARAAKCGYNFDPAKLKAQYLAFEQSNGLDAAGMAQVNQIYDVGFSGVTKVAAAEKSYCTEARTKEIKAALSRHLAGDYTPAPIKKTAQDEEAGGGLFSWGF